MKDVRARGHKSSTVSPLAEDQRLLQTVQAAYSLADCSIEQRIKKWGSTVRWQLRSSDGKSRFLKEKPYYLRNDEFEFHLRLHSYVWEMKGPVVALLRTVNNEPWLCWEGRKFELQEWFEDGEDLICRSVDDSHELGILLSRFLLASAGFNDALRGDWTFPHSRADLFPETSSEIESYAKHIDRKLSELGRPNDRASHQLQYWMKRYGSVLLKEIPQQFIHGDPCGSNFLTSNSLRSRAGGSVLIDLDCAHWGYRLSDVSIALAVVAGMVRQPSSPHYYRIRERLAFEHIESFLKGFNSVSPLTSEEMNHLSHFLGLNLVRAFITCLELDDLSSPPPSNLSDQLEALIELLNSLDRYIFDGVRLSLFG